MDEISKLREALSKNEVRVVFRKKDGSKREMRATTDPNRYHYEFKGGPSRDGSGLTTLWDLDLSEWRSMRNDSLIEWAVL